LVSHMFQVHKKSIKVIPNAKPGRESIEPNIFGMSGVPEEFIQERLRRLEAGEEEQGPTKRQKTGEGGESPEGDGGDSPAEGDKAAEGQPAPQPGQQPPPQPGGVPMPPASGGPAAAPVTPTTAPPSSAGGGSAFLSQPAQIRPAMPAYSPYGGPGGYMPRPGMPYGAAQGYPGGYGGWPQGPSPPFSAPPSYPSAYPNPGLGSAVGVDFKPLQQPHAPAPSSSAPPSFTGVAGEELDGKDGKTTVIFVYKDAQSMEEKRAQLPRYRYQESTMLKQDVDRLGQSIAARLQELKARQASE